MRKTNSTNFINEKEILDNCPITSTFKLIGGRWKVIILWNLRNREMRYNELDRAIPKISQKMLTQQLKSLIDSGFIVKKDFKQIPPKTEYSLSGLGKSFIPVLQQIYDWGISHEVEMKVLHK